MRACYNNTLNNRAVACDVTSAAFNRNVWQKRVAIVTMVRSCSAVGCVNRDTKENRDKGIKFYRIPVNPERRRLWLAAIGRKDFDPPPDAVICSVHFIGGKCINKDPFKTRNSMFS